MPNECPFCGELLKEVDDQTEMSGHLVVASVHCRNSQCDMKDREIIITVMGETDDET